MKLAALIAAAVIALSAPALAAQDLSISLSADAANPASPQMGDRLSFHSTIRNDSSVPVNGIIGWISLVRVDKGQEQPVDLEDWSAHKAITLNEIKPGGTVETDWPMRLIQAGQYRVVISTASRTGAALATSPFADFSVREKPVVESARVLPVAFGIPLLIALAMIWSGRFSILRRSMPRRRMAR